mgnify:CR=1 FL=1
MKSTLYLKFILLYIILGFLSIFTVASLSSTLTTHYLESSISGNMYQSANLLASNYLPDYFSKTIALADVYTQLNGMSDYLNSDIWFVDNEGSLLASAKSGDIRTLSGISLCILQWAFHSDKPSAAFFP